MSGPLAWLVETAAGGRWVVFDAAFAKARSDPRLPPATVTPLVAAPPPEALEAAARLVEGWAAKHYPEDVFTPDGTTVDAQSARAIRAVLPAVANAIRELVAAPPEDGRPTYDDLQSALSDTVDELADALSYVPDHFREKWNYDDHVASMRSLLARIPKEG